MTETPKTDAASVEALAGRILTVGLGDYLLPATAVALDRLLIVEAAATLRALLAERDHAQDLLHAREQDMHDLAKRPLPTPPEAPE